MIRKGIIAGLWLVWMGQPVRAQHSDIEWKETPNRFTLSGSLLVHGSEPDYGLTLSYARFLNAYWGIEGGLGVQFWSLDSYQPQWEVTDRNGRIFRLYDEESTMRNLNVQVGPLLRLPIRRFGRAKDHVLAWECRPAWAFTLPNQTFRYLAQEPDKPQGVSREVCIRNRGGQWNYWQVNNALCLQNDVVTFSLGYTFSHRQPFSSVGKVFFEGKNVSASVPSARLTHEFYLSLGCAF